MLIGLINSHLSWRDTATGAQRNGKQEQQRTDGWREERSQTNNHQAEAAL